MRLCGQAQAVPGVRRGRDLLMGLGKSQKSLMFDVMVESEVESATDLTPGVGGHGAALAFS